MRIKNNGSRFDEMFLGSHQNQLGRNVAHELEIVNKELLPIKKR